MELTVVIVNYRVKYLLEQTLRSVERAMQGMTGEVIVVDNLSGDDSIAFSRERHPKVTYIENQENVGFARANNQALEAISVGSTEANTTRYPLSTTHHYD